MSATVTRLHTDPEFKKKQQAGHALRKAYGDYWKYKQPHPGF